MKNTVLILTAALIVACCSGAGAAAPVRVAVFYDDACNFPLMFAEKEGYFAKEGITVKIVKVDGGTLSNLLSGKVDAVFMSAPTALAGYEGGKDLKILARLYGRFDIYAISRFKPAESGKILSVALNSRGAEPQLLTQLFIDYLKLDPKSFIRVYAAGDEPRYALMEEGKADLTVLSSVKLLRGIMAEKKYFYLPIAETGIKTEPRVIAALSAGIEKRGPELEKFLAAFYDALKAAAADGVKASAYLQSEYGYTPQEAAAFYAGFSAAVRDMEFTPAEGVFDGLAEKMNKLRPSSGDPRKLEKFIDDGYAKKIVKSRDAVKK